MILFEHVLVSGLAAELLHLPCDERLLLNFLAMLRVGFLHHHKTHAVLGRLMCLMGLFLCVVCTSLPSTSAHAQSQPPQTSSETSVVAHADAQLADAWAYYWAGLLSGGDLKSFDQGIAITHDARATFVKLPASSPEYIRLDAAQVSLLETLKRQRLVAEVTLRGQFPLIALLRKSLFLNSGALGNYELVDDPEDVAISRLADDMRDGVLSKWGAMAQTDVTVLSRLPDQALDDKVLALLSTTPKINLRPMAEVLANSPPEAAALLKAGDLQQAGPMLRTHFGAERFIIVTIDRQHVTGDVHAMNLAAHIFDANSPDTFSILGVTFDRRDQKLPLFIVLFLIGVIGIGLTWLSAREHLMFTEVLTLGGLSFLAGMLIPNALLGLLGGIAPPLDELAMLSAWWTVFAALVVLMGTPIAYTSLLKRIGGAIPALQRANEFSPHLAIAHGAGVAAYLARGPVVYDPDWGWLLAMLMLGSCIGAARLVAQLRNRVTVQPLYMCGALIALVFTGPAFFSLSLVGVGVCAAIMIAATAHAAKRIARQQLEDAEQEALPEEIEWDLDDEELAMLVERARRPSFQVYEAFERVSEVMGLHDEQAAKQTHWCLIHGQRGSGKTATSQALIASLPKNTVVLRGACSPPSSDQSNEASETRPFEVFVRAFDSVGVFEFTEQEEDIFSSIEGRVIGAIPIVSMLLPSGEEQSGAVSDRGELYARVVRELTQQTRRHQRRVVLVLDDIQWIDAASLELLLHLMNKFPQSGETSVSFLLCGRKLPESLIRHTLTRKVLASEQRICVELPEHERLDMMQRALGFDERSARMLDEAVTDREGKANIGWLLMLIEAVARSGQVIYDERATLYRLTVEDSADLPVPENLKKIVGASYDKLEREDQELVRVAACLGYSINLEVLARVVERHRLEVIERLETISELTGLVEDDLSSDDYFKFVSTQRYLAIRDFLGIKDAHPRERQSQLLRDLHLKIARVMELLISARHTTLADVAHHYWLAGLRDLGKALHYCKLASRAAREVFAFDTEELQLKRAQSCAELQTQVSSDEVERTHAAAELGELELALRLLPFERAHILGRQDLQQEQAEHAEKLFLKDVSDGRVDVPLEVLVAMTRACYDARRFELSVEMAEALVALGDPDGDGAADRLMDNRDLAVRDLAFVEGLHFLGVSLDPREQASERLEWLERAEQVALGLDQDDPQRHALVARVQNSLGEQLSQGSTYDFERAQKSFQQSIAIKRELKPNDKPGLARAYGGLGRLYLFGARKIQGRKQQTMLQRARGYFLEDVELCQDYGDVAGECQMHSHLGECEQLMGQLAAAMTHYERSNALAESTISRGFALLGMMRVQHALLDEATDDDQEMNEGLTHIATELCHLVLDEGVPGFMQGMLLEVLDAPQLIQDMPELLRDARITLGERAETVHDEEE